MLKRFFNLGLISLIGITISGCGAVMKPVFKAGFKALTKNSDEVVGGASKNIFKNSDNLSKGFNKNTDSIDIRSSSKNINDFDGQQILKNRPLRIAGKELNRNNKKGKEMLVGGWMCHGDYSESFDNKILNVKSYTSETYTKNGEVNSTGTMWIKILSGDDELLSAIYSIKGRSRWDLTQNIHTLEIKEYSLRNTTIWPGVNYEDWESKRKEIDNILDIDNLIPIGTISEDKIFWVNDRYFKLIDIELNQLDKSSYYCRKKLQ